jgi:putative colanic acid biosynthesis UDP-glucose lipid carrier transferase
MVTEFMNFPMKKLTIGASKFLERKRNSHRFYSYSKSFKKKLLEEINREAENDKIKISLIPSAIQNEFFQYDLGYIETQPILTPSKFPLQYYTNAIIKRSFDIFILAFGFNFYCDLAFPYYCFINQIRQ